MVFFFFMIYVGEILSFLEGIMLITWYLLNKVLFYKLDDNLLFNNMVFIILISVMFFFLVKLFCLSVLGVLCNIVYKKKSLNLLEKYSFFLSFLKILFFLFNWFFIFVL